MKVLLINPMSDLARQSKLYLHSVTPLPPLGLAYLSAILKADNREVFIEDQYATAMSNEDLVKKIRSISPEVIGFSCLTTAMGNTLRLISRIREQKIRAKIILGNIHPTLFPDELLQRGSADIIVRGEGEFTLRETVNALAQGEDVSGITGISYLHEGLVRHNPDRELVADLDDLPFPDWRAFDLRHYRRYPMLGIYDKLTLPVQGSRGCPFDCLFCSQDKFYKRPRYRDVKRVVSEIEYLVEEFGVQYVGFTDAYFPFSKKTGMEFCDEYIRRNLHRKIKWFTESRVDAVDAELMRRMKEANLYLIMYGFEVGNQKVLDAIGKKTTLSQAREAMAETKKNRIRSLGLFMLGLPEETRASCLETIAFAKELDPDFAKFNIAVPFPGSRFFEESKEGLGLIDSLGSKFTSWHDWSSCGGEVIYSPKAMAKEELLNLQRKGMFDYYMRPKVILKHVFRRSFSLSDLFLGAFVLGRSYLKTFALFRQRRPEVDDTKQPLSSQPS